MARQCLEAGKHTFIEKPMARSTSECLKLIELAGRPMIEHIIDAVRPQAAGEGLHGLPVAVQQQQRPGHGTGQPADVRPFRRPDDEQPEHQRHKQRRNMCWTEQHERRNARHGASLPVAA